MTEITTALTDVKDFWTDITTVFTDEKDFWTDVASNWADVKDRDGVCIDRGGHC